MLKRSARQAGESLYLELQARLAEIVERMPSAVRYPALSSSWAEVCETDDEE